MFGYNFIESEPICMKSGHSEYNVVAGALADFGCNRRSSDNLTVSRNFGFFGQANNARFRRFPVGKVSRNLNTTTSIGEAVKLLKQNFENIAVRGRFFNKTQKCFTKFQRLATSGRHITTQ